MKSKGSIRYFTGMVILLAVVVFLLCMFAVMGRTKKVELYLIDRESQSYGWRYETLTGETVTEVTPVFMDEYLTVLPGAPADAVRITRIFTEELSMASLQLSMFMTGVEVFVDGNLLYSDFQSKERNGAGFLLLNTDDIDGIDESKMVRISLPEDYTGKEISIITYFKEKSEGASPVYPMLVNDETDYASIVAESVFPAAVMTICAVLAVLLAIVFLLDMQNERVNFRTLLFVLFFVLLFLYKAYYSVFESTSALEEYRILSYFSELYMVPLFLYLALNLTKWRKILLSGGVLAWALYEGIQIFINLQEGNLILTGREDVEALILLVVLLAVYCYEYFFCRKGNHIKAVKRRLHYVILLAVVIAMRILYGAAEWEGDVGRYLYNIVLTMVLGNCKPIVHLLVDVCAVMSVIILVLEFIRRTMRTRETLDILEERSSLIKVGYDRMLRAEEATNAVRHELRHHMIALIGMLKEQETERACEYITSVIKEMEELPVFQYSRNVLVNVIAGVYLDKAKAQGIEVKYRFALPVKLGIADADISVLLTNMLENALEACERMKPEQKRYIQVRMQMNENFLFIECINSMDGEEENFPGAAENRIQEQRRHGYGMAAMRKIAEKYGSILKVEKSPSEFGVRTNLCLKQTKG